MSSTDDGFDGFDEWLQEINRRFDVAMSASIDTEAALEHVKERARALGMDERDIDSE